MKQYQRVFAAVHMDALEHNLEEIRRLIRPDTKIIAVIKMDAYSHGAVNIAELMEGKDYIWGYAVATIDEAVILRNNFIRKPILVLGYTFPGQVEDLITYRVQPSICSMQAARVFSDTAAGMGRTVPVHIKLDTGMSRIGFQITEEDADEIAEIAALPQIKIEGIFSHFAKADEKDKSFTEQQLVLYRRMIGMLQQRGVDIPMHHISNSAGILDVPQANMNAVRAGIIMYGLWPSDEVEKSRIDLRPVMELKSHVVHVKTLQAGRLISYGGTYEVQKEQRIATIPVGYGDGYARSLSNRGSVLIHGRRAPVCGRVCMDQFMVDVTEIPDVRVGDEVTLIGRDGQEEITMEELGALSGRFNYEFVCDLGKRVPRVYDSRGRVIGKKDYFEE